MSEARSPCKILPSTPIAPRLTGVRGLCDAAGVSPLERRSRRRGGRPSPRPISNEAVMRAYRVALIPGDGVGQEVVPAGVRVLERAAAVTGAFTLTTETLPWGCEFYLAHRRDDAPRRLRRLADFDAIYLGAVGYPGVPDHVSLWGLLLPIRQRFDQYVNLRPIRLLPDGIAARCATRARPTSTCSVIRENTEGEYCGHRRAAARRHARRGGHRRRPCSRARAPSGWCATPSSARAARAQAPGQRHQVATRSTTRWCCGTRWCASVGERLSGRRP